MKEDIRYQVVKARFEEQKVKHLGQIVRIVPKTVLAKDLRKNTNALIQLIENPERFKLKELIEMGELCGIGLMELLKMAARDSVKRKRSLPKDVRYEDLLYAHKTGALGSFERIFEIVPRSVFAGDLKMKRERLGKLVLKVEDFKVKDLLAIAEFSRLSNETIFSLVISSYDQQKPKKKLKKAV